MSSETDGETRPVGLPNLITQRPVWIIVYCVLLLVRVTKAGHPSTILAGELASRKITVSAEFSASGLDQFLAQSSLDSADVPLLPAVPGGGSVPLPPSIRREPSAKTSEPVVNGNNLVDGTGKYSGMLLIPGGTFEMGSPEGEGRPDERPNHQVFVKDFYIAKQDVTAQDYCGFLKSQGENSRDGSARIKLDSPDCPVVKSGNAYKPKDGFADKPVVCVSWHGATEYAEWVGGRLPTAAEREKAALLTTPRPPADRLVFHQGAGILSVSLAAPGVTGDLGNVWQCLGVVLGLVFSRLLCAEPSK